MTIGKAYGKGAGGGQTTDGLRIWQFQDFTAPVSTGVTLTAHSNGTGLDFVASEIVDGSAVATLSADPESPVTTTIDAASIGDPANRVAVSAHTGASVTLDQTPHTSLGVRVWYLVEVPKNKGLPEDYQEAPKFVRSALTDFMDATYVNNFGDETVRGVKTFLSPVSSPRQIIAGTNMTGGGDLTADRTLNADLSSVVPTSRTVTAGSGLSGGGALSGNITLSLAALSIAQGDLKTTTGEVSTTSATFVDRILPGGEYGFYPQVTADSGPGEAQIAIAMTGSFATTIALRLISGAPSIRAKQRFVQASPPYDLGDGEVWLFVFVEVNSLGNVVGVYVAPDPPWANNGPTSIRPTLRNLETGTPLIVVPRLLRPDPALAPELVSEWARQNRLARQFDPLSAVSLAALDTNLELVQITQALKQADMPLIPHPFPGLVPGNTVVVLDPPSNLNADLLELHEAGESVAGLIHDGHLVVDNVALSRAAPPGVMPVACRWK